MVRVLLTTTSFQDTPGPHHEALAAKGYDVIRERGPLSEERMLELVGDVDALLCGDDAVTRAVLEKALPRLRVVAKYGIGLDKVDVAAATVLRIPVTFCPGVNHTTVAEHTFALLLALSRQVVEEANFVRAGQWKRLTGHELFGRRLGIVGMGRIGREVAVRARAFGMEVCGCDVVWDDAFASAHGVRRVTDLDEIFRVADVVTLHAALTPETRHMVDERRLGLAKPGVVIVNCARGELVETGAMVRGLESGHVGGYGADVFDQEPPPADHPLLKAPQTVFTPHIGSRTYESVVRQAGMALENMIAVIEGRPPLAQANSF